MPLTARHVKNLPGRKTDVAHATWLAQLGAHGLVRGSFVPPEPIRRLRDLTRTRTSITRERSREVQRLEKLLEDSGIKLSSVATDIMGVSSRSMIEALIRGDRDVVRMADLAQRRMRAKIPRLTEALVGRFTEHHAFLAQLHLNLIDQHTAAITQLTDRIAEVMEPFRGFHDLVRTIPGIGPLTADVIVAETGADMSQFPTGKHLASWAGTTPGNNESAGQVKSSRTRPGTPTPTRPTSRSSTRCSSRSGRWAPPAPRTTTPAPTTTPVDAPSRHSNARSISSKRWATASASTRHPEPTTTTPRG